MSTLRIDRLGLRLSGIDADDGRRLATLIAERFSVADLPPMDRDDIGALRVGVSLADALSLEEIADRVVREVLRRMESIS